ncbi:MBL fold metallo-hydrolase [Clostridium sp.]|uniref:MBL fold metallo-hydrolase n=1 Tax=Clostridium sp. TaxID=1506 RepID=UPI002FC58348
MKITTIIENELIEGSKLYNEHGLCYFIEVFGINILFDTGKTYRAYENFKALGLENKRIDYIILSHGHYDHVGGLKTFIANINNKPKVIVGNEFFKRGDKYHLKNDEKKFIGIDFDFEYFKKLNIDIIEVKNKLVIEDNINIISNLGSIKERKIIKGEDVLSINNEGVLLKDDFREELVINIEENNNSIVVTGCAHNKIDYIAKYIRENYKNENLIIVGGIHLSKANELELEEVVLKFKKMNIKKISLCHCSGHKILNKLKVEKIEIISGITGSINEY